MSIVAKQKLAEITALSADEMREIMLGIENALEELEDIEDVKRIHAEIARGEAELVPWEDVKKNLGLGK
ncbi:MAG: hypothetical protein JNM65_18195 [Verrucomicrobiaceae bacterium]|nr:hypothetical protein [Verrucomicrobiaceae bacterium]